MPLVSFIVFISQYQVRASRVDGTSLDFVHFTAHWLALITRIGHVGVLSRDVGVA